MLSYHSFRIPLFYSVIWLSLLTVVACRNREKPKPPKEVVMVEKPEEVQVKASEQMQELLRFVEGSDGKMNDSTQLRNYNLLRSIYSETGYEPIWSSVDKWKPTADSLFFLISKCREFGLFPSDYHLPQLLRERNNLVIDTAARKNIALWTRSDILLTDGFLQMLRDVYTGRLDKDSITQRYDTLSNEQRITYLKQVNSAGGGYAVLESLEPKMTGYQAIRAALPAFLDSVTFKDYTYVKYPAKDSMTFVRTVAKRLQEDSLLSANWTDADSSGYAEAVKKYQAANKIKTTGIAASLTVQSMNSTTWDKFKRIAVNLDRYKQLPATMPPTYIWVNLPAFSLKVMDADTVALASKVIVGAPKTRTPVLSSQVVNFITSPQWTVPYSIIFKEMLPKIQKDINYLNKQNLMVVDKNDSVINPATIDWSKLSKTNFPYLLRQRQGDDNSLGVMKFNFRNKYDVYLHDTNARGLFARSNRAMSHGCVRVQEWSKLSQFLVRDDTIKYPVDTLKAWISRQEKHVIADFDHVPVYLRYFTVDASDGRIKFYDDIYGDDRLLTERYFKSKLIH